MGVMDIREPQRMPQHEGLNRRSFLRNAGLTALAAGAAGAGAPLTAAPFAAPTTDAFTPDTKYDFDTPYNRFGTHSVKYDQQLRVYGPNSVEVGMGIADIDFKAAPSITKALQERLQHENWGYLDLPASFVENIIGWNKRHYGVAIEPAQVVITMGVHPGLIATLRTFSPKGSKVLLQTPTYNGFYGDLTASQTLAEEVPLKVVNGTFQMDFEAFEKQISVDTNSFILCNPQNPTGNCWSAEDLLRIGEICLKHRVVVLADEIHCDWVTKGQKYTPFASLANQAVVNNSITFKAASKSFGLAAHKIAWFYSTNPDYLARIKVNHRAELNTLGIVANQGAYTPSGEDWLTQAVEYVDGNHDFALEFIKKNIPMVKTYTKAQGTYLMWLNMTELAEKINTKAMAEAHNKAKAANEPMLKPEQMLERWLVKYAKVHMNQGAGYGKGGENHVRMNIGTSRKTLEKALTNVAAALKPATLSTAL
jgi:cystathionine beta-lyase